MQKKHIPAKGYPLTDPAYPVAHMLASREELHKFGGAGYERLNTISRQNPMELLGTHKGHQVIISSIVPVSLRPEVRFHERREIAWMERLKKKR